MRRYRSRIATMLFSVIFVLAISSATAQSNHSLAFPEFSYKDHPMHILDQFAGFRPVPVIMKKYVYYIRGQMATRDAVFTPGSVSYNLFGSKHMFCRDLDSLYIPFGNANDVHRPTFLEVDLNNRARVFLVLKTKKTKNLSIITAVQGLDSTWKSLRAVSSETGEEIPVGGSSRHEAQAFPANAIVLEKELPIGETLNLPHPQSLMLNGAFKVSQYFLLFAQISSRSLTPDAFSYPTSPETITKLNTGTAVRVKSAKPNEPCPTWLHDLYRTPARRDGNKGEELYWHTWHPIVDPVYYCYFSHEHGSYPGNYRPPFGYTAFKTSDPTTPHGRQIESDEGFKVLSIPLPEQERFIIITVHMQGSSSRRFTTRFHTGIFAVFDKHWNMELELFMKMDFGAAVASLTDRTMVPIDVASSRVFEELKQKGQMRVRRINVLNLEQYPTSVDTRYMIRDEMLLNTPNQKIVEMGVYEKWSAGLNTCSRSGRGHMGAGFTFDIRNIATGKKHLEDGRNAPMQWLRGDSIDRKMVVGQIHQRIEIGIEHCRFDNFTGIAGMRALERNKGVFYTDSYFSKVVAGPGRFNLKQFMKPGFKPVSVFSGTYTPTSPWGGLYNTDETGRGKFLNIENAVKKEIN